MDVLVRIADGDARVALNTLDHALLHAARRTDRCARAEAGNAKWVAGGGHQDSGTEKANNAPACAEQSLSGDEKDDIANSQLDRKGIPGFWQKDIAYVTPARERTGSFGKVADDKLREEDADQEEALQLQDDAVEDDVETPPAAVTGVTAAQAASPETPPAAVERSVAAENKNGDGRCEVMHAAAGKDEAQGAGPVSQGEAGGLEPPCCTTSSRALAPTPGAGCLVVVAQDVQMAAQVRANASIHLFLPLFSSRAYAVFEGGVKFGQFPRIALRCVLRMTHPAAAEAMRGRQCA